LENLDFYIFGRKPIITALKAGTVSKVFIQHGANGPEIEEILSLSRRKHVPSTVYDRKKFKELTRQVSVSEETHQGVIALKSIGREYTLDELIDLAYENSSLPLLLFLDGIQDPHNFGAIARTAEVGGVNGLLIPTSKNSPITPVAYKTSAGALEHLPHCYIGNFPQDFSHLKERGFWIVGTDAAAEDSYTSFSYDVPLILVIGNEGEGMRPAIRKQCDSIIKIPLLGHIDSLNVSVAAGIIIFEILRQRGSSSNLGSTIKDTYHSTHHLP